MREREMKTKEMIETYEIFIFLSVLPQKTKNMKAKKRNDGRE